VQLPAETHDTEDNCTPGSVPELAGGTASIPGAQLPAVSVSSSPCRPPKLA
jgi:hypothetical protein